MKNQVVQQGSSQFGWGSPRVIKTVICNECKAINLIENGKCRNCGIALIPINEIDLCPRWLQESNEDKKYCEKVK